MDIAHLALKTDSKVKCQSVWSNAHIVRINALFLKEITCKGTWISMRLFKSALVLISYTCR